MKKITSKFLSILLIFLILIPTFALYSCKQNEPLTFTFDDYYTSDIYDFPETIETTLYFEEPLIYGKYGIILSNYDVDGPYVTLCVNGKGILELLVQNSDLNTYELLFNKVTIEYKKNTHLALTFNYDNNEICCYVNGELEQSIKPKEFSLVKEEYQNSICFGGDTRLANYYSYRMGLVNVYGYSDLRTADEIKDDAKANKKNFDKSEILFYYDTNASSRGKEIKDLSGNKYHLSFVDGAIWVDKNPVKDYSFSFSFVGDTQVTNLYYPDELNYLYDYLAENYNKLKTKMVFGLGDITNDSTKIEYDNAKANIAKLDGIVDYSIIRGNHDKISDYDSYFSYEEYGHIVDGTFDGTLKNTYKKLVIGSVKFLIITIDYGCDIDIINKISNYISQNPDYNVIITTHAYLTRNGKLLKEGNFIWDNLAKKYSNIVLIISGHVTNEIILHNERLGDNGNVVHEFMIDPQEMEYQMGPTGMLTNFFFSEDGKNVEIETYSTKYKRYFMPECQMNITLNLVG